MADKRKEVLDNLFAPPFRWEEVDSRFRGNDGSGGRQNLAGHCAAGVPSMEPDGVAR